MKFAKGAFGFIQPLTVLKNTAGDPEDLTNTNVTLILIDMRGVGSNKTIVCSVVDPTNGGIQFQPADATVFDTVTDYKIRAEITDPTGLSMVRYTEPGYIIIYDPNK